MKTLDAYFTSIRQLIQNIPEVHIERYEEQILSADRGNLPHISTHPDHKHSGNQVLASTPPSIEQVLEEVLIFRKASG